MKYIDIGILAHVDAGKTTLSEAILFQSGAIRKAGRVDHKDAFLDTDAIERERGITVFSKEARFDVSGEDGQEIRFTLLDTPGHSDFSCEMERTLRVLDYAILVISGSEGVQSHTMTLWKLLKAYDVPAIIFVNKMDMPEADRLRVWNQMNVSFGGGLFEMSMQAQGGASSGAASGSKLPHVCPKDFEELAMLSEPMMEAFLDDGSVPTELVARAIAEKKAVPVIYGSALRMEGTDELLAALGKYAYISKCEAAGGGKSDIKGDSSDGKGAGCGEFSATVYKISRDRQGVRQTHMKIMGGALKTKMLITGETPAGEKWSEKVEQIRLYNSTGFENTQEAGPGEIVAVTGLNLTYAGESLGESSKSAEIAQGDGRGVTPPIGGILQPALTYRVNIHGERDNASAIRKFAILEEENPSYHFVWD
ncbi:MAG: GTP-binding protein, partial [Firmicutes bacterium]|nr:GTP-binding protein [Bacillota bacterium]